MKYFCNGRVVDKPEGTVFHSWEDFHHELAQRVARRELIRIVGWELAATKMLLADLLVQAVIADPCRVFTSRLASDDVDWPRFACFANWALQLPANDLDRLLTDIKAFGTCTGQWAMNVLPLLDEICCNEHTGQGMLPPPWNKPYTYGVPCTMQGIYTDPCLQGTGRVSDLVVVPGQPHPFHTCGVLLGPGGIPLPKHIEEFSNWLVLAEWLGITRGYEELVAIREMADAVFGEHYNPQPHKVTEGAAEQNQTQMLQQLPGKLWPWVSPSGSPLPPPMQTTSYDLAGGDEPDGASTPGWLLVAGAAVLLVGVGLVVGLDD